MGLRCQRSPWPGGPGLGEVWRWGLCSGSCSLCWTGSGPAFHWRALRRHRPPNLETAAGLQRQTDEHEHSHVQQHSSEKFSPRADTFGMASTRTQTSVERCSKRDFLAVFVSRQRLRDRDWSDIKKTESLISLLMFLRDRRCSDWRYGALDHPFSLAQARWLLYHCRALKGWYLIKAADREGKEELETNRKRRRAYCMRRRMQRAAGKTELKVVELETVFSHFSPRSFTFHHWCLYLFILPPNLSKAWFRGRALGSWVDTAQQHFIKLLYIRATLTFGGKKTHLSSSLHANTDSDRKLNFLICISCGGNTHSAFINMGFRTGGASGEQFNSNLSNNVSHLGGLVLLDCHCGNCLPPIKAPSLSSPALDQPFICAWGLQPAALQPHPALKSD